MERSRGARGAGGRGPAAFAAGPGDRRPGRLFGTVAWHDYRAEAVGRRYGHEWNVSVAHKFGARCELLGKWADCSADGFATDTRKAWLMVTATF